MSIGILVESTHGRNNSGLLSCLSKLGHVVIVVLEEDAVNSGSCSSEGLLFVGSCLSALGKSVSGDGHSRLTNSGSGEVSVGSSWSSELISVGNASGFYAGELEFFGVSEADTVQVSITKFS